MHFIGRFYPEEYFVNCSNVFYANSMVQHKNVVQTVS